jgi:hypothetical protein
MRRKLKLAAAALVIGLALTAITGLFAGVALGDDQHNHYGYLSGNAAGYGQPSDSHGIGDLQNMWGSR